MNTDELKPTQLNERSSFNNTQDIHSKQPSLLVSARDEYHDHEVVIRGRPVSPEQALRSKPINSQNNRQDSYDRFMNSKKSMKKVALTKIKAKN